jgi:L-ribulose-5-phosphate 3-epimerase
MNLTRRNFIGATALGVAAGVPLLGGKGLRGLKIGVTDWNLHQTAKPEAVELAKRLGFAGVEVSLGMKIEDNKLPLDNPELQARYLAEFKKQGIGPAGTCLDALHRNYLKNDKLGQKWVADGIRISKALGAKVMLLPFFGKGALTTTEEMDYVGDVLRDLAQQAGAAGVTLGLEDTISAENNVRIMDRVKSEWLKVYYDIGNSTGGGFDVPKEIEWLGKKRICQFHFKDNPNYLGEGKVKFRESLEAISRIGFGGFANLETDAPSKDIDADMKKNLAYAHKVILEIEKG